MDTAPILIAEGDDGLRRRLAGLLCHQGHDVVEIVDRSAFFSAVEARCPDLAIVGSSRDGSWDGLELAREIRRWEPTLPIILVAAQSTESLAIAALKAGITDYFSLPLSFDELMVSVNRCLADFALAPSTNGPESGDSQTLEGPRMIGDSRALRALRARIAKVAPTDSTVLITGETGTGKELVAELLHRCSRRCSRPLVSINCAAIPDSLLESELFGYERGAFTGAQASHDGKLKLADGGTAFLDEIGDMSSYAQAKILRVIETKEAYRLGGTKSTPFDARLIAATNQDLLSLVTRGTFRKDLYFRLNVVHLHLPPLRERRQDIPLLVDHYVADLNRRLGVAITGVTASALEALTAYDWPGNVRELKNLLEELALDRSSGKIFRSKLPARVRRRPPDPAIAEFPHDGASERHRLVAALTRTNWNKCRAAAQLHWSRMTLYRKMAKHQIIRAGNTEASNEATQVSHSSLDVPSDTAKGLADGDTRAFARAGAAGGAPLPDAKSMTM